MTNNRFIATVLVLLAAHCTEGKASAYTAQAATGVNPAGGQAATVTAPAGQPAFYILAEFSRSLNAKKLKPGDQIKAEVTQDVVAHGKVVIPVESKLIGHVTEVKPHRRDDPESRLGIIFDKVLLKHRMEVDFRGVLQALKAPAARRSRVDEADQMFSPSLIGQTSGSMPMGSGSAMGRNPSSNSGNVAYNPAGSPPPFSNSPPLTPVPATGAGNAAPGIPNQTAPPPTGSGDQGLMSLGMPRGVFGLKGLSLTARATASTPGPVILCLVDNVKLESGTQVLLKVTQARARQP